MLGKSLVEGIGSGKIEKIIVAKVKMNVDFLEAITEIVRREKINKGVFIGGIGALKKAVFRNVKQFPSSFPVTDKDRIYIEINRTLELVSLTGHISPAENNKPNIHAHFAASTIMGNTVVTLGGHLTKGTITHMKVAVVIAVPEEIPMKSKFNPKTKTQEMVIEKKTVVNNSGL